MDSWISGELPASFKKFVCAGALMAPVLPVVVNTSGVPQPRPGPRTFATHSGLLDSRFNSRLSVTRSTLHGSPGLSRRVLPNRAAHRSADATTCSPGCMLYACLPHVRSPKRRWTPTTFCAGARARGGTCVARRLRSGSERWNMKLKAQPHMFSAGRGRPGSSRTSFSGSRLDWRKTHGSRIARRAATGLRGAEAAHQLTSLCLAHVVRNPGGGAVSMYRGVNKRVML
mmetsp:Transcript_91161/g.258155  ORF Transcript_91161/g.258155 Transcript_91161/m.258155 type:complete len:228 (+) Transcript_91161:439-1122(+)